MKKVLIVAILVLGCSAGAKADGCNLISRTGWGPNAYGTWACTDSHGNNYEVYQNLWEGIIDHSIL